MDLSIRSQAAFFAATFAVTLIGCDSFRSGAIDTGDAASPGEAGMKDGPSTGEDAPADMEDAGDAASARDAMTMDGSSSVVLFGGNQSGVVTGGTWIFDGSNWTPLNPSSAPSARENAAMATKGNDGVVLFGGEDKSGTTVKDTWTYDGDWNQPTTDAPTQSPQAMAAGNGQVVLVPWNTANFTWLFNDTTWSSTVVATPSARMSAQLATLKGATDSVVLFGGQDGEGDYLSDTWSFNGTGWTALTPATSPPGRYGGMMSSLGNEIVLFGGEGPQSGYDDTWIFDGSNWKPITTNSPGVIEGAAMAPLTGTVVLFGGDDGNGNYNGDTWTFDGQAWAKEAPAHSPSNRTAPLMSTLP